MLNRISCVIALLSCLLGISVQADDRITIGVSLPLSGDSASEGEDLRTLLNFANEAIAKGAYNLQFEDDRCSDKEAVAIAQKFVSVNRVKFVLGFACSGALLAAAPIYDRGKVVVIGLAAAAPAIAQAGDFIFRTIPNLNEAAERLHQHAAQNFKSIGILSEETAYAKGLAAAFIGENPKEQIVIESESYLPLTSDFRTLLAKFQAKKVEALFLNPQAESGMINLFRQLSALGWKPQVYGTYYPGFPRFLEEFGKSADGIIFADLPFVATALEPDAKQLYSQFSLKHGKPKSSEFYFITAVSAFQALHEAIVHTPNPTSEAVKDYLYQNSFRGVGGEFRFDGSGDVVGKSLAFVLKTIRGGAAVNLDVASAP